MLFGGLILAVVIGVGYNVIPHIMIELGGQSDSAMTGDNPMSTFLPAFLKVAPIVAIIAAGIFLMTTFKSSNRLQEREDSYNANVYPKMLSRYNQLQYCDGCHTLFDGTGNAADANELGFNSLMEIKVAGS